MTPREIVRRTVDFENPERVARSFRDGDLVWAGPAARTYATEWHKVGPSRWERLDEWGNTLARLDPTSKGEVARGVLDDLGEAERYRFPDFSRPEDYEGVRRQRAAHPDKWVLGPLPGMAFNIARKLRRLEQYLEDLLDEPAALHALHDRIDVFLEHMIRNYAAAGADAVMIVEDWGTQERLMINPVLWRQEFGPRFVKLCGLAHALGLGVFMHSCGQVEAIVPDLMAAGVDVFQFDQPDLHGAATLAAHQQRGKVTFWCPVDIQKVLQTGDEAAIRAKAREMLAKLWRGRGGFIAGVYPDLPSIGVRPEWQEWACDEFVRQGVRGIGD